MTAKQRKRQRDRGNAVTEQAAVEDLTGTMAKRHARDGRFDLVAEDYAWLLRWLIRRWQEQEENRVVPIR